MDGRFRGCEGNPNGPWARCVGEKRGRDRGGRGRCDEVSLTLPLLIT